MNKNGKVMMLSLDHLYKESVFVSMEYFHSRVYILHAFPASISYPLSLYRWFKYIIKYV